MITKITPEDLLKLGRQQTCSQFVFMMAESIGRIFDDLRIRPQKGKDTGVVYFQKVDTIRGTQTKESRELCLIIAYYYIRIFQIFAALSITVLDDPGAGPVLGAIRFAQPAGQQVRRVPGARGGILAGGADQLWFAAGKAKVFAPVRELFENGTIEQTRSGGRVVMPLRGNESIEFIPERVSSKGKSQNLRIDLQEDNTKLYGNIELGNRSIVGPRTEYTVAVGNFELHDASASSSTLNAINRELARFSDKLKIASDDGGASWSSGSQTAEDKIASVVNTAKDIIMQVRQNPMARLEELQGIGRITRRLVPEGLTAGQQRAYAVALAAGKLPAYGAAAAALQPYARDVGAPRGLENQYLIDTLKAFSGQGQKTVGFCVARALQLLDADTLAQRNPTTASSRVCMAKFDALPTSVPEARQRLDRVTGLHALDQLYATKAAIGAQDKADVVVADTSQKEYADFLQEISSLFGQRTTSVPTAIGGITARDPCETIKTALQITDPKSIANVRSVVGRMFGRQLQHTQRVLQFFNQRLFLIKKSAGSTSVHLHPRLLAGGIDEVNAVSKAARELLLQYYKDCETMYQEGMKLVLASRR